MDNKQLISLLADRTGLTAAQSGEMMTALVDIIADNCANLNSVAIPGFGTFTPAKTDEYVATDSVSGVRTLMPPAITVKFNPSIILRKKL